MYAVEVRPRARRQLAALPKGVRETVGNVIDALAENPRPPGAVALKGTEFLRVRVRDYRIVYQVADDILCVLVIRVGHRSDVYRRM